jgi:hypothetical protein
MVCKPRQEGSVTEDAQQVCRQDRHRQSEGTLWVTLRSTLRCNADGSLQYLLYPRVPFIALILPISASPSANVLQALDQFDPHHVFCMLVAELALDAEA